MTHNGVSRGYFKPWLNRSRSQADFGRRMLLYFTLKEVICASYEHINLPNSVANDRVLSKNMSYPQQ